MPYPDYPCPKCNSWIDPPAGTLNGQKFRCPRCDDMILWLGPDISEDAPITSFSYAQKTLTIQKKRTALGVVFIMTSMAVLALIFALSTQKQRRNRDLANAVSDPRQSYLKWISGDSTLIGVIDLQKLKASKELSELLNLNGLMKDSQLTRKFLGTDLSDLKLVTFSMLVDRPLASSLFIQTLKPVGLEKITNRLQAVSSGYKVGRETFRYQIDLFPIQPTLSKIDNSTIAFAILPERMESIPGFEREGLNHLGGKLQPLIVERIPASAPVWIALQAGKWDLNSLKLFFPSLPSDFKQDFMEDLEAIGIWLEPGEQPILRCEIMGVSPESILKLEKKLASLPDFVQSNLKSASRNNWLTLQMVLSKDLMNFINLFKNL